MKHFSSIFVVLLFCLFSKLAFANIDTFKKEFKSASSEERLGYCSYMYNEVHLLYRVFFMATDSPSQDVKGTYEFSSLALRLTVNLLKKGDLDVSSLSRSEELLSKLNWDIDKMDKILKSIGPSCDAEVGVALKKYDKNKALTKANFDMVRKIDSLRPSALKTCGKGQEAIGCVIEKLSPLEDIYN